MALDLKFRIVIPARYGSTRLEGKLLESLNGKSVIQRVYENARRTQAREVIIATDDERIYHEAVAFGANPIMTSKEHKSGTDRIGEIVTKFGWDDDEVVINLQGDEPFVVTELVHNIAKSLIEAKDFGMASICSQIKNYQDFVNPNVVKVVLDKNNYAVYFSRAPIPWNRDELALNPNNLPSGINYFRHIGIYGFKVKTLRHFIGLPRCELERAESLEQLRAIWFGIRLFMVITDNPPELGIDTLEDLENARLLVEGNESFM